MADVYMKYGDYAKDDDSAFLSECWGKTRENILALTCSIALAERWPPSSTGRRAKNGASHLSEGVGGGRSFNSYVLPSVLEGV